MKMMKSTLNKLFSILLGLIFWTQLVGQPYTDYIEQGTARD